MSSDDIPRKPSADRQFEEVVGKKEIRHLRAQRRRDRGVWFGLGMFGLVGWSVVIPTLIGLALGLWIDATWPSGYSWTLMCLVLGVALGCYNAWNWIGRESRLIDEEEMDIEEPDIEELNIEELNIEQVNVEELFVDGRGKNRQDPPMEAQDGRG